MVQKNEPFNMESVENRSLIGGRLKEERERLGFSQPAFAAIGGASKGAQITWEKGTATPNAEFLNLAARVGVDVLYVLTGERSATAMSPDEQALLAAYRALDVRGKAAAIGAISGLSFAPQSTSAGAHSQVVVGGSNNVHIGAVGKVSKRKTKRDGE